MELGFLDCLLQNVDSVTRSAITNELVRVGKFEGSNVKRVSAELLRDYLVQGGECASDYGPMAEHRSRFVAGSLNPPSNQFCPAVRFFFFFFFFFWFYSLSLCSAMMSTA